MSRQKNWSYNSYDESEDISVIGNYIWDSNTLAWIKQTPAASGGGGPVTIADGDDTAQGSRSDAAWVSGNGTVISLLKTIASATGGGGLTDAQLRATPVPVSGPLTDLQLRASAVAISGTVSISGTVPVSGPLTDTQLRASAVPVSGPLTDTQLRATPVPVSGTVSVTGVATESTLATRLSESDFDTKTGSLTESAPASDTASSGLNGRLQRIAQRITSLIALLPAALVGGRLDVNIGAAPATVTVTGTVTASGPLTDTQLRATPVPVSGTVTSNQGAASANDWRMDLRRGQTILFAIIDTTASGFTTLVAADATKKVKILSYALVCGGTVNVYFASASTKLTGAMPFVANTGIASPVATPAGGHLMETAVNEAFRINLSAGQQVSGSISYFLEV